MPPRAFFRFGRSASLVLATSALAGLPMLAGCDYMDSSTSRADKRVDTTLAEAESKLQINPASAQSDLETAAKESGASTAQRLRATALLADSELKVAQDLAVQVARRQAVIDRLAVDITALTNQVAANNDSVATLKKYSPDSIQDMIKKNSTSIAGSESNPDWYKTDTTALASLAADDKQASALQQQISQLQDTIKSQTDQRTQLLNDADKFNEQSEREKGQKSVDLFVQGSNARKQAGDLSVQLDAANVQLTRAQADLGTMQGQHTALQASIKLLADRSATVDDRWKTVQGQIDELNAASKALLGDESAEAPALGTDDKADIDSGKTIASKSAVLKMLLQKNHDDRATAEAHFNDAIGHFGDAYQLAGQFKADLAPRVAAANDQKPEYELWKDQLKSLDQATFSYLKGDAQLQKAEFYAGHAAEDKTLLDLTGNLKPIFDAAQLTMPASLIDNDLDTDMKTAQGLARDKFKEAVDTFTNITEGASEPENKLAAQMQLIYAHYGWSLLENAAGDPQTAGAQMELAKSAVALATGDNAYLPSLPPELAAAPAASVPGSILPAPLPH